MKKKLMYCVLLFFCVWSMDGLAQTAALDLQKYNAYRERLRTEFMFCAQDGRVQGAYLPAELRKTDAYGYRIAYLADGTWWQGHYVAMLATEYARLRKDGDTASAAQTLEELRKALQVYDRLDLEAEGCWNGEASLNGFYLRDDVPASLKDTFAVQVVNGDYTRRCGDLQTTSNGPSQDQAWASYPGLALVCALVDDEAVKEHAASIACRLVQAMQYTDARGKESWQVVNPVTGAVMQPSTDIQWLKYAHAQAYKVITGNTCTFGDAASVSSRQLWQLIQQYFTLDRNGHFNWYGVLSLSAVINEKPGFQGTVYDWLTEKCQVAARFALRTSFECCTCRRGSSLCPLRRAGQDACSMAHAFLVLSLA